MNRISMFFTPLFKRGPGGFLENPPLQKGETQAYVELTYFMVSHQVVTLSFAILSYA